MNKKNIYLFFISSFLIVILLLFVCFNSFRTDPEWEKQNMIISDIYELESIIDNNVYLKNISNNFPAENYTYSIIATSTEDNDFSANKVCRIEISLIDKKNLKNEIVINMFFKNHGTHPACEEYKSMFSSQTQYIVKEAYDTTYNSFYKENEFLTNFNQNDIEYYIISKATNQKLATHFTELIIS